MSPERRRVFVQLAMREFGISERRACRAVDQPRATQRRKSTKREVERRLVDDMLRIVRRYPRYGYRRVHDRLRRQGWSVNHKRVFRLWRREGLRVPQKRRKRRSTGSSAFGVGALEARQPNQVWAMDFVHDRDSFGKSLRWIMLIDEFTRECLHLEVHRRLNHQDVKRILLQTAARRGAPEFIRSDNGPEFVAGEIRKTLDLLGSTAAYVEPGAPWQNGYAESFNARFRDELLAVTLFHDLREAQALSSTWEEHYNHDRPHSALRYLTPREFAAQFSEGSGSSATPTSPPLRAHAGTEPDGTNRLS